MSLSSNSARPGTPVVATLKGWAPGAVTVSVCGNDARRGSPDCDALGSVAAGPFAGGGSEVIELVVRKPPLPCPCVVRAASRGNEVVRTAPITVDGQPVAPVVGSPPPTSSLVVSVALLDVEGSFWQRTRSGLGGRTPRTLELEIKNTGVTPASQISVNAAVGRDRQAGEPLLMPDIAPLLPGEVRRYSIPVVLPAPAYGRYLVFGSVFGAGNPVRFEAVTSTTPALLVASIIILGVVSAAAVGARMRAWLIRRDEERALDAAGIEPSAGTGEPEWLPVGQPKVTSTRTTGKQWPIPAPLASAFRRVREVIPEARGPAKPTRPRHDFLSAVFRSRRAAWSCAATTALFLLVIIVAAGCSSSGDVKKAADAPATAPSGDSKDIRFETQGIPARIEIGNTRGLVDGDEVKLKVSADPGSQVYGFEAFLCRADATYRFDADARPTLLGKCLVEPLSDRSDRYMEVPAAAPFESVEAGFRVGTGTGTFTRDDGKPVSITCGQPSPCRIVLKVQYPGGFGFVSQVVEYR